MDATYYNGSDTREFSDPPEPEPEPVCELTPEQTAVALDQWLRDWATRKVATRAAIERAQQRDESKVPF